MPDSCAFTDLAGTDHLLGIAGGRWSLASDGVALLDVRGLPSTRGLVDAHAHLGGDDLATVLEPGAADGAPRRAWAHVEAGVFLVFDKGHRDASLLHLASLPPDRVPDLDMAGRILYPPQGYYPGFAEEVDLEDLAGEVEAATTGARWVKLVGEWPRRGLGPVPNFDESQLALAVDLAHRAGCRVAIHTTGPDLPSVAVRAGVDSIEHGLYLSLEDVAALGARRGQWVPTLVAMEAVATSMRPGSSGAALFEAGLENVRRVLPEAVAAGVRVLGGTDLGLPHGAVAAEAAALVRHGLDPGSAVEALTRFGWEASGRRPEPFPGDTADLVVFRTHPAHDLSSLTDPLVVMRAGTVVVDRR